MVGLLVFAVFVVFMSYGLQLLLELFSTMLSSSLVSSRPRDENVSDYGPSLCSVKTN